jgi:hypothetical protein
VSAAHISPSDYWSSNAVVAGFWERDKTVRRQPEEELEDFLDRHERYCSLRFRQYGKRNPEDKNGHHCRCAAELNFRCS